MRSRRTGRLGALATMAALTAIGAVVTVAPSPTAAAACDDPAKSGTWADNCVVSSSSNYWSNLVLAGQYVLYCNGFAPGPRDGIWSPSLQGAVLRFQQSEWPNDARRWTQAIDRDTWIAMRRKVSFTRSNGNHRYFRAGIGCRAERFVRNTKTGVWKVREEVSPVARQYVPMGADCGRGDSLRPAGAKSIRLEAAALAKREKARWAGRTESDPTMRHVLDAYWMCGYGVVQPPHVAWSAAFVSHVMKVGRRRLGLQLLGQPRELRGQGQAEPGRQGEGLPVLGLPSRRASSRHR